MVSSWKIYWLKGKDRSWSAELWSEDVADYLGNSEATDDPHKDDFEFKGEIL